MELKIGNLSYSITRFNYTIDFENEARSTATATLDPNINLDEVSAAIKEVYDGSFSITYGDIFKNFTGYTLRTIDMNLEDGKISITIRFEN